IYSYFFLASLTDQREDESSLSPSGSKNCSSNLPDATSTITSNLSPDGPYLTMNSAREIYILFLSYSGNSSRRIYLQMLYFQFEDPIFSRYGTRKRSSD